MKRTASLFLSIVMVLSLIAVFPVISGASDAVLIDYGSKWRYVAYEEDPAVGLVHEAPEGWLDGTDNETWTSATAPIGAKQWGSPVTRLPYAYYSAFFRKTFKVTDLSKITSLTLLIKYDENPTVYLNGTEVWSAVGYVDSRYVEVSLDAYIDLLKTGENTLQVAISNVNGGGVLDAALICTDAFDPLLDVASDWEFLAYERHTPGEGEDPSAVQTEAPEGWLDKTDSASWESGQAPFAGSAWPHSSTNTQFPYGNFDAYLRTTFTLDDPDSVNSMYIRVIYDEDPVVYLNGTVIWSASGYKDSGYQLIFLNDRIGALKEGENVVCVYFRNKTGGGGSVFDMGLYYNSEPEEIEYYDEDGWIVPLSATGTNYYQGDLGKPENVLDGSQNTVCGYGFNNQTVTIHFRRPEMLNKVFVQCKDEGTTSNDDGSHGTYDIYAVYNGKETLIGENIPAITGTDGGYLLELDNAVPADAVTVKITSWQGTGWACVADLFAKSTGEEVVVEVPHYNDDGSILGATASCRGFSSFGNINKPENVLDNDQGSVCGSGYNPEVEQSVTVTFQRAELVNKIFLQCKNEGPTETAETELDAIYADGGRGVYAVYAINGDKQTLIRADVPAITGYRGGYTLTLDQPVRAEAIKVIITDWYGTAWACVADVVVFSEGPAGDAPVDPDVIYDIDNDGELSIGDVSALLDLLALGTEDLAYDLDEDECVSISDVSVLLDALSGQ